MKSFTPFELKYIQEVEIGLPSPDSFKKVKGFTCIEKELTASIWELDCSEAGRSPYLYEIRHQGRRFKRAVWTQELEPLEKLILNCMRRYKC